MVEVLLEYFEKEFVEGWFYSFTVPVIQSPDGMTSVSFVVPMQDAPNPPVFAFLIGPDEGDAYDYVFGQSWNPEEFDVQTYGSPQAAIDAAKDAAVAHAANNPGVPQIMWAHTAGGDDGVDKYVEEIVELERLSKL